MTHQLDSFSRECLAVAMRKLFEQKHFSICDVDHMLKLAMITPNKAQYDALHALHCVDYSAMTPEFREQVYKRTLALFADGTAFDLSAIDRGFMLQRSADIGNVVSIQSTRESKRKILGLF